MTKDYSAEVTGAVLRVARIFDAGCDRCDADDLALLEEAGLMDRGVCRDTFGHDTLQVGEAMWSFNAEGQAIVDKLLANTATEA